jgi:hypothetical protein
MTASPKTTTAKRTSNTFAPDWSRVQLSADLEHMHAKWWKRAVKNYEKDPSDFFNSYEFLLHHPANVRRFPADGLPGTPESWFEENLRIMVVKVDPKSKRIETKPNPDWKHNGKGRNPVDSKRNTEANIWLEWGPFMESAEFAPGEMGVAGGTSSHDPRVDTGARTFEKAIVRLANNIYHLYGPHARVSDAKKLPKKLRK